MKVRRYLAALICTFVAVRCLSEQWFIATRIATLEELHLESGASVSIGLDMPIYTGLFFIGALLLSYLALRLAKFPVLENVKNPRLLLIIPLPLAMLGLVPLFGLFAVYGAIVIAVLAWFTLSRSSTATM